MRWIVYAVAGAWLATAVPAETASPASKRLDPLAYTIRFPDPASKTFVVDVTVPPLERPSVDMMMAIWSPGFYGLQNYADGGGQFDAGEDRRVREDVVVRGDVVVRPAVRCVEHLNSVAITTSGEEAATPEARFRTAAFLSHEYFQRRGSM